MGSRVSKGAGRRAATVAAALIGLLAAREAAWAQGAPPPPARRGEARPGQAAVITGFEPKHCVDRGSVVIVHGALFGALQGERRAVLGGHGISVLLPVRSWSDRRIEVIVPDVERIQDSQWYYIGLQDGSRHWISNISKTITMCRGLE
jgi:hypothetical protein